MRVIQLKLIIINYSAFKEQNHYFSGCNPVSVCLKTLVAKGRRYVVLVRQLADGGACFCTRGAVRRGNDIFRLSVTEVGDCALILS